MAPNIVNQIEDKGILKFTIQDINVSFVNAIRRCILSEISIVVFKTFPHSENDSELSDPDNLVNSVGNNLEQSMNVEFSTRPKAEIDDIVAFFESLGGVTKFRMTIDDTNGAETIKVVCKQWSQTWAYDDFYNLSATLERVYEA